VRILLDECVPARLKKAFPGHSVQTVTEVGWRTAEDQSLLAFAQTRFDVFVTVDRKLEKQNDLSKFNMGFIIMRVPNNRVDAFDPILADLSDAVEKIVAGTVVYVVSPRLR
jgi:predicted nuclease of predicted toxin-antitoxin system